MNSTDGPSWVHDTDTTDGPRWLDRDGAIICRNPARVTTRWTDSVYMTVACACGWVGGVSSKTTDLGTPAERNAAAREIWEEHEAIVAQAAADHADRPGLDYEQANGRTI